jgi:hypothetical protein
MRKIRVPALIGINGFGGGDVPRFQHEVLGLSPEHSLRSPGSHSQGVDGGLAKQFAVIASAAKQSSFLETIRK